jgi:NitT/TauT family transport system ATP-binding protein
MSSATGIAGTGTASTPSSTSVQLEYTDVDREFVSATGTFVALHEINLTVKRGDFLCIVGPSGCGKSTLLNLAAGLLRATHGSVVYDGAEVRGINNDVGYVTQADTLLPWRTVERNVGLPLEVQSVPRKERRERVRQVLARVGLTGFEDRYPSQLSGGMLKRAGLAQTLVYEPQTLLMDEPFGALDAQLRMTLQQELLTLWERDRMTVLFVTHDIEEAILLGNRMVVFGANPGRIIHVEDVTVTREGDFAARRADPAFTDTWERIWALLKPELEK